MDYKQKKEIYLLNLLEGSMHSHPPEPNMQNEVIPYEAWFEKMVSHEVWEEDIPEFSEQMKLSNIKQMAEEKEDVSVRFRTVNGNRHIWKELIVCNVGNLSLLVVKDIHKKVKKEVFHKSIIFYQWVRKRLALMVTMEKECGLIIFEMKGKRLLDKNMEVPYKIKFIEPELKKVLEGHYRKEMLMHKDHIDKFVERILKGTKERDIEFMKIRMENDSTCWIQLYGKVIQTASGRTYVNLVIVNAYDYKEKNPFHELHDTVEHLVFEWNVEDDTVSLSGPWEDKFVPLGEEVHKGHEIEPYIYKSDLLKFQKISNLVLSGKSQEDILLRFNAHNKEKEYRWCTVSFLSVMYDNSIPMFALGRVKDIDSEMKQVLKSPESEEGGVEKGESDWNYITDVLEDSDEKQTHALFAGELELLFRREGRVAEQKKVLSAELFKRFSEILSTKDKLFLEEDILYIFLYGADINEAESKQTRLREILEGFGKGGVVVNTGLAVWPKDGTTSSELKKKVLDKLKFVIVEKAGGSLSVQNQGMLSGGGFSEKLPELIDEWYSSVRLNQQMQNQIELVESQLLLSQIQPHFIYNVLANVKAIMFEDLDKACELLVRFTRYLRSSFRSVGREGLVPFTEIIRSLDDYIELEKYRFEDKISVVYDIQYSEFVFTYFILQPIVENSIRHGICKKVTAGTVTVRTYKKKEKIYIIVEDDGVGFEPKDKEFKASSQGIGLKNVELRLRYLMGGEMHLESNVGKGTRIELVIPKI